MKSLYKAVAFDMDGVLIDARKWHFHALNVALEPFDMCISETEHDIRFDGLSTRQKLEILTNERGLPRDLHPLIFKVKQERTLRIAAAKCWPNPSHQILLSRLMRSGIRVGMYTNSIRETSSAMLKLAKIDHYLEVVITNEDVKKPKPNPEGYELLCRKLDINPVKTLVIEDGNFGIEAARGAGCDVLKVEGPNDVNLGLLLPHFPELGSTN